jgi:hypothetical protein
MMINRLFVALLTTFLLAACGGGDGTSPSASAAPNSDAAPKRPLANHPDASFFTQVAQAFKAGSNGANVFVDRLNPDEYVTSIRLCAGAYVDSLQLTTNQRAFAKRGGEGGYCQDFALAPGETIQRVFGGAGAIIDRLGFETNQGRTLGPLGGPGGRDFSMQIDNGPGVVFRGLAGADGNFEGYHLLAQINLIGDLTGGDGGTAFIDRMKVDEVVTHVTICYRPDTFVYSVQLRTNLGLQTKHGDDDFSTPCVTTQLGNGEYITELFGAAGRYVDSLGFATNYGRVVGPFGGPGGAGFSQKVTDGARFAGWYGRSGGWLDKIGLMTSPAGKTGLYSFADQVPAGQRVGAVKVCAAYNPQYQTTVLRSVQTILESGAKLALNGGRNDNGTTCETVNFGPGEFITEMFGASGDVIDRVGFRTNTGRQIGPFGGPGGSDPFILRNPSTTSFLGFAGDYPYDGYLKTLDFGAPDVFAPAAPPDGQAVSQGWWSSMVDWPLNPLHVSLLDDGRLLSYGTGISGTQGAQFNYDVWNPSLGMGYASHLTLDNTTGTDLFCTAQTLLPNGTVLLSGGDNRQAGGENYNKGVRDTNIFSPSNNSLVKTIGMNKARWYATQTMLPSGRVLVTGGIDEFGNQNNTAEVYTPGLGWKLLPGTASPALAHSYPRVFVAPQTGVGDQVYVIPTDTNEIHRLNVDANGGQGSIVDTQVRLPTTHSWDRPVAMVAPGKVLIQLDDANTVIMQIPTLANGAPTISFAGKQSQVRVWSKFVVLPTGEVLATGGSEVYNELINPAYHGEIWNPGTKTWRRVASELRPRLYHSSAILLADGRVLSAGGGSPGPVLNLNAQAYYPPYLFAAGGNGAQPPRPAIDAVPGMPAFNTVFGIQTAQAATIGRVTLTRLGSSSHSFEFDTRHMDLIITQRANGTVSVRAPASKVIAPPGKYLITLIDNKGVPSVSRIITFN